MQNICTIMRHELVMDFIRECRPEVRLYREDQKGQISFKIGHLRSIVAKKFLFEKVQNKWPSRQTPEPFIRKPVLIAESLELTAYRLSLVVLFDTKLVANVHWSRLTPP